MPLVNFLNRTFEIVEGMNAEFRGEMVTIIVFTSRGGSTASLLREGRTFYKWHNCGTSPFTSRSVMSIRNIRDKGPTKGYSLHKSIATHGHELT